MVKKIPYLIIFLLPIVLLVIYFQNINGNRFLFLHDEYLILNKEESLRIFFTQNPISLGISNTTVLIVSFFDKLYYFLLYFFGFQLPLIQRLLYFIKLFLLLLLPYIGFTKLSKLFIKKRNTLAIFFVSLWYSFNTYTLIYLHGNAFSLTLLLCYSLAPLGFYYYHSAIFDNQKKIYTLKTALVLFFMSFAVYLYAVFLLFIFGYTCLYWFLFRPSIAKVIKNLLLLALFYLPFSTILLLIPYDMFFSPTSTLNVTGGETFGNLQGGLLYPFLMWFSWGIYTYWEPRNIFTFYRYFYSIPALLAPFIIYTLLLPGVFAKKKQPLFLVFLLLFLLFLFLIKGAQSPFGGIYVWFVDHIPGFRVFRSPDNKFGFILIFLLCIMLIHVASAYKKKIFTSLLGVVILIQGYLIFNGVAIRGENTPTSSDHIVTIPNEYYRVTDYFNKNIFPYGYIMPIPSVEFGHYKLEPNKRYIGQDILPKLTNLPFLYISADSGIASNTYEKLSHILKGKEVGKLSAFAIKYFLIRNDSINETNQEKELKKLIPKRFKKKYSNKLFTIFENEQFIPMIQASNSAFVMVNPITYRVLLKNINDKQQLYFNQSYNPNWVLYPTNPSNHLFCDSYVIHKKYNEKECQGKQLFFEADELGFLFTRDLFSQTHTVGNEYINTWTLSSDSIKATLDKKSYTINPDGSVNLELVLYFKTQLFFYLGVIITGIYICVILPYILWNDILKHRRKSL